MHKERKVKMIMHVDDMMLTGRGELFKRTIAELRRAHDFGSWKVGEGKFLGGMVHRRSDGSVTIDQAEYCSRLRYLKIPPGAKGRLSISPGSGSVASGVLVRVPIAKTSEPNRTRMPSRFRP